MIRTRKKEKNYEVITDDGEVIGTVRTAGRVTVSQGAHLRTRKELCATSGNGQIHLTVQLKQGNLLAMIDSGATGNFMSRQAALRLGIPIQKKKHPYQLTVVSGDSVAEDNGWILYETKGAPMGLQEDLTWIKFDLVVMQDHEVILGMPWLKKHNPRIDWTTGDVNMGYIDPDEDNESNREEPEGHEAICATGSKAGHAPTGDGPSPTNIPVEYKEFEELFRERPNETALPKHQPWDHEIPLEPGKKPGFGPIYSLSQDELKTLKEYLDTSLERGLIRESTSPAGSPVLFVPKPDGTKRLCMDYRSLNNITIKDRYALPLADELRDRIQGATEFTILDLRGAYNLIRIKEGEEWKTAFRTRYGLYETLVMPFGLTNAPATCQRLINHKLHEYLDVFVVAYLDDILVYSRNHTEHVEHVRKVLTRLKEAELLLKPEKCQFFQKKVKFLGFILSAQGIQMDASKVQAVQEWPTPTSVKEVQSFLGFANFYRRFIKGYSRIATPLTELTKKDKGFQWNEAAGKAFQELKDAFAKEPILATFNPEERIVVETDASDYAIGACISQPDGQGVLHPIAFYSRKMTPAELNYEIHDKELLAIVMCFQE